MEGENPDLKDAFQALQREVRSLEAQIETLSSRLETARQASRLVADMIEAQTLGAPSEVSDGNGSEISPPELSNRTANRKKDSQVKMVPLWAREVIVEAGRPLNRSELWEAFQKRGYTITIDSANIPKYIGKILWHDDEFVNVHRQGYWIKGMELPVAENEVRLTSN